jgi:acyl-CoA thioester hydrolase
MSEFTFETEIEVRFRDLDAMGHVNNAVYATYLEQARAEYIQAVVGETPLETGVVIADLHIDFEQPIDRDGQVTVAVRVDELGTSSIPLEYEVRTDGDLAATGRTLMVTVDESGDPKPVPDAWREHIREFEGR